MQQADERYIMGEEKVNTSVEELSFKEASRELELIVRALESGELELEESIEKYTRGVELLGSLRKRLSNAEQKVETLVGRATQEVDSTSAPSQAFLDE